MPLKSEHILKILLKNHLSFPPRVITAKAGIHARGKLQRESIKNVECGAAVGLAVGILEECPSFGCDAAPDLIN